MKKTISKVAGLAVLLGLNPSTTSALNSTANDIDANCQSISQNETFNSDLLKDIRAFKKQSLGKEGFIAVYNQLISQSQADRSRVADLMRNDFASFADNNFILTREQQICVSRKWTTKADLQFIQDIADFVEDGTKVNTWNVNVEEAPQTREGGKRSMKDVDFSFLAKKRKVSAGYSEDKGWNVGFSFEW